MTMSQQTTETGASLLSKAATVPPVTAGAFTFAGFQLPELVQVLTGVWFVVLISHKLWKWRIEARQYRDGAPLQGDDDE